MKTAVITSGTRGIGAGLVKDFLKLGWNLSYTKNGAKIAWLTSGKVMVKFLMAPFSKRCCIKIYVKGVRAWRLRGRRSRRFKNPLTTELARSNTKLHLLSYALRSRFYAAPFSTPHAPHPINFWL